MRYMGSKARYAKAILAAISKNCNLADYENWVEPFVGGAHMIAVVTSMVRWGSDINPYLICMFKATQNGWEPSDHYSEEAYQLAKGATKLAFNSSLNTAAEIGFIGIGCSYAGKWFGGYARGGNTSDGRPVNYAKQSKNSLLRQKPLIQDVVFSEGHYENMCIPKNQSIIYCDPPYACTTKYSFGGRFENDKFWDWCNEMSQSGHKIFISEYQAPKGWQCIWENPVTSSLTKDTGSKTATERLFTK